MEVCSDGEWDWVLVLLLRHPVACKFEICLFKLATLAISSLNSVVYGVATVAKDGKITSITLLAISAKSFQSPSGDQYSLSVDRSVLESRG